ncbi:DNA damage-inducible protein 1 [Aspergillus lentulus]|nr:DNA damage-inducible protein 1 [Aspergillus lentulus]
MVIAADAVDSVARCIGASNIALAARFLMLRQAALDDPDLESSDGVRYLPNICHDFKGEAGSEYPVFDPHAGESKVVPSR